MTPAAPTVDSSVTVETTTDDETGDLVGDLSEELDQFAFERERVLAKLDIRAAGRARRIARELRVVLRGLPLATSDDARDGVMATLADLLHEAHELLDDPRAEIAAAPPSEEPPLESGERPLPTPSPDEAEALAEGAEAEESAEHRRTAPPPASIDEEESTVSARLPHVALDEDEESSFSDLTIARKVVWERNGNRILGR